ncbi:hypothetical protein BC628DRAFT_898467 [Trametes gibbosa]|nr:hypothetical protein BC628DRAFT_898467 [Trametes gibbosa]
MRPPKPLLDPVLAQPSSSRRPPRAPKRSSRLSPKLSQPPDPSSGLLALLVTVAGSSSADARPLDSQVPPDFLCPHLHAWSLPEPSSSSSAAQKLPSWYWEPCDATEAAGYVSLTQTSRKRRRSRVPNKIADKYTLGPDGRWRKADSWELYGSSSCSVCLMSVFPRLLSHPCDLPPQPSGCMDIPAPTEFPVQDDQVSPSSTTSVVSSSSTSTSPSLPPGWDKGKVDDTMTGMILALSLSLAVALIVFMMGIVRWRQKRHAKLDKDAEQTPSVLDGASVEESEEHKRARSQQRLWAKVSARWVAKVRQSARRRRKHMAVAGAKDSDSRLLRDVQASTSAVSLARTSTNDLHRRPSSPSSLRSTRRMRNTSRSPSPAPSDRHSLTNEPVSSSHRPPAYLQSSSSISQHAYTRWRSHPLGTTPDSHHASGITSRPNSPPPCSVDRSPPPPLSPLPYEPPVHSAHVAVDDKAVLARLVRLASAPPPTVADRSSASGLLPPGGSSESRPSVPMLDDDPYGGALLDIEFDSDAPNGLRSDRRDVLASQPQAHDAPSTHPHGSSPHGLAPQLLPLGSGSAPLELELGMAALESLADSANGEVPSYAEDALLRRHRSPLMSLPPPPAKVPLTGPMFYEYPDEFERDVETVEPLEEPSAPPFNDPSEEPPLLQYTLRPDTGTAGVDARAHVMTPSAPPLEHDIADAPDSEGLLPSAPPLHLHEDNEDEDPDDGACSNHDDGLPSADVQAVRGGGGEARSAPLSPSPDDQGSANACAHDVNLSATVDISAGASRDVDSGTAGRRLRSHDPAAPPQYLP